MAWWDSPTTITGTPDAITSIGTNQILFNSSSNPLAPPIGFQAPYADCGIFRYGGAIDCVAVSAGGQQIVNFWNGVGIGSVGMAAGLNLGLAASPPLTLRRLTSVGTNGTNWNDGHLGNAERLYFTSTDFQSNNPARIFYDSVSRGQPVVTYTNAAGVHIVASKILPCGFRLPSDFNFCILTDGGPINFNNILLQSTTMQNDGATAVTTFHYNTFNSSNAPIGTALGGAAQGGNGTGLIPNTVISFTLLPTLAIPIASGIIGAWVQIERY